MDIKEYRLIISGDDGEKKITYLGNENITIESNMVENEDDSVIFIPRYILEKFIEIIQ